MTNKERRTVLRAAFSVSIIMHDDKGMLETIAKLSGIELDALRDFFEGQNDALSDEQLNQLYQTTV